MTSMPWYVELLAIVVVLGLGVGLWALEGFRGAGGKYPDD